jgi:hypothetical protein
MQPREGCGYRIGVAEASIPLNGPVFGSGWWVAAEYDAAQESDVQVRAGDSIHEITLPAGEHTLLFSVEGRLRSVQMSHDGDDPEELEPAPVCVTSLVLGSPATSTP